MAVIIRYWKLRVIVKNNKVFYVVIVNGLDQYPEKREELTAYVFEHFECSGVQDYSIDEKRVDEILGERAYSGGDVPLEVVDEVSMEAQGQEGASLIFFFDAEDAYIESELCHEALVEKYSELEISRQEKDVEDWDAKWRDHYKSIQVTNELTIVPEWEKGDERLSNEVYIYPGQGFGTGGHETTFLCLKLFMTLDNSIFVGKNCLDFGCGSGILGIVAIKKSKMYVDFCDIDRSALENTLQNINLNLTENEQNGHRLVLRDRFSPEQEYSLVFANILKPVLISEKDVMTKNLMSGGYLIISGLLNEQVDDVLSFYSDFKVIEVSSKGDWSAVLLQKDV